MAIICNQSHQDYQFPTTKGFFKVKGNHELTELPDDVAYEIHKKYQHLEDIKNGKIEIRIDKKCFAQFEKQSSDAKAEDVPAVVDKKVNVADHKELNPDTINSGYKIVPDSDIRKSR